jgi:O-antigen/teichoic acid export membrane protein
VYGCLNTPQVVRLRWDLVTMIDAGTTVAQLAAVPIVLVLGGGLVAAVTVSTAAEGVRIVLHLLVSRRLQPRLFHVRIRRSLVGPLLRFGGAVVTAGALAIPLMSLERLFLARYASTASLAFYSLAATAAAVLTLVPLAVCQPLLPGFTRLHATGDRAGLQELYGRAVRGILLLGVPAAVVLCVAARPGLTVWAGANYGRESTGPLYVLLAGVVIHGLAYVPYNVFLAANRARVLARLSVVELVLYIPVAAWLTRRGAMGAATAWSVRAGLDTVVLFVLARRSVGMRFAPLPGVVGRFFVAVIPIGLCAAAALALTEGLAGRAAFVVVGLASYAGLVWTGVLSDRERAWIRELRDGGWRELGLS